MDVSSTSRCGPAWCRGSIALALSLCEADRYLLANYNQESLKFLANGQPVEAALNLHPGQIFKARVAAIWKASCTGQLLPSGTLQTFQPAAPETPQSQYVVKTVFDAADQSKFGIRSYSWLNFLYPIPFDERHCSTLRAASCRRNPHHQSVC